MKKIPTKVFAIFLLLSFVVQFLLLSLLINSSSAEAEEKQTLKIGVILPLSGDIANVGEAIKNGVQLGYKKLPKEVRDKTELIFEDDRMQAKNTVTAFNKLSSVDKIDLLINASSGTGNALAPLAERKKIPFVSISSDPKVTKDRKYVVQFWVTPDAEGSLAVKEALKRGYDKIAMISSTQDGYLSLREHFYKHNKDQIKVSLDEDYPDNIKDFRTFVAKIRNLKDLDAVLVNMLPGQCGNFVKQLREMKVELPVFGFETFEDGKEVEASNYTMVGAWYVNADDPGKEFINEYKQAYPEASFWIAPNAHDAMLLLGSAIEQSPDTEKINEYLHTVKNFNGALGTFSATEDNHFTLPAAVKVVTKDGFEKISR